jgi:putative MATE family efflux protein
VLYVGLVAETVWRACGDSRTPMLVVATGTLLNVALDPFLILGIGPFPAWGVRGAAIATVISEIVVVLLYGALAIRGRWPLARPRAGRDLLDRARVARIVRIGMPHAAIGVLYSVVYLFLARVTGGFGAPALAALGIVNRLESLDYLTATAMGMGVATLVGQNLGAGRPERAERAAHLGARFVTLTTGLVTIVYLALAEPIVRIFTTDPASVAEAARFLRIVAISQVFMGWEITYDHAFTGAGDTLPPMIVSVGVSVLRLPLAWGLAVPLGLGPDGVWWTISLTGILRGLVMPAWFLRGRWKTKDVGVEIAARPVALPALAGPDTPDG